MNEMFQILQLDVICRLCGKKTNDSINTLNNEYMELVRQIRQILGIEVRFFYLYKNGSCKLPFCSTNFYSKSEVK